MGANYVYMMESPLGEWVPRHVLRERPPAEKKATKAKQDVQDDNAPVRRTRRWRLLEDAIYNALVPFADARRAVAEALTSVEPPPDGGT